MSHWPLGTHAWQPVAVSWQVSVAPLAPQRLLPCVQDTGHSAQAPPWQTELGAHCCAGPHAGQLFWSMRQVSTPAPWHRVWPGEHEVPQVPQAPPLQKLVQVCVACQRVQPAASATQVSTPLPLQRVAPAVQVPLQLAQLPPWHLLPLAQVPAFQVVQPESTSHSQVRTPVAVHSEAPMVQAWQVVQAPPLHSSP
jgi:hypothetical protein